MPSGISMSEEFTSITFVREEFLNHPYTSPNTELGDQWLDFVEYSEDFDTVINTSLKKFLCDFFEPELEFGRVKIERSKEEDNILIVYLDTHQWAQLSIKRYGFLIRGEPTEKIYILDYSSFKMAA